MGEIQRVLSRHPGDSSCSDGRLWFGLPTCQDRSGVWLKPGEAVCFIKFADTEQSSNKNKETDDAR
jgi:hypothetical protein